MSSILRSKIALMVNGYPIRPTDTDSASPSLAISLHGGHRLSNIEIKRLDSDLPPRGNLASSAT